MKEAGVAVFCAASENISPCYINCAKEVGSLIGRIGLTLVYGGAAAGLMEVVACAVKKTGGVVVGVVPEVLEQRNRVSSMLDVKVVTKNLSDRKDNILERSKVLVALPGGIGTLDEIFHVMAAATIGYHNKKIVFYNYNGFWNPLLAMLGQLGNEGFVRASVEELFLVADDCDALEKILKKEIYQ